MPPLRLLKSRAWWYAHRMELPGWYEGILLISGIALLCCAGYVYDAYRMGEEVKVNQEFMRRVLQSMSDNGRTGLYEVVDPNGAKWWAGCNVVEHKL